MTNSANKVEAPVDDIVIPHDLFNRLYLYFDANANVSDECADFMNELSKLKDAHVAAMTPPPKPELTKFQRLLIQRETASWRHGELGMHGAAKEVRDEAWAEVKRLDAEISEERRRMEQIDVPG